MQSLKKLVQYSNYFKIPLMKRIIYLSVISSCILWSCGQESKKIDQRQGKGGIYYGGVFKMNEVQDFRNLYPLNVTEVVGHRITNQVYEGLVRHDQNTLTIEPCLAESWEVNEDATSYTFKIRKGVKFHDNECFSGGKGREITANDFEYCFTKLCSSDPQNQGFWVFEGRVVGADEYYQSTIDGNPLEEGVKGITVVDDYTLKIDLNYSFSGLPRLLGTSFSWLFPQEAVEKYGIEMRVNCVGTGPFIAKTIKEGEAVILSRNEHYWGMDEHGNQLPYMDAIKYTFLKEKKAELLEFRKGKLDMIFELPIEMIDEVMGELKDAGPSAAFNVQVSQAMAIQYYGFQHKSDLFSNKAVRKAFNYAIDREAIATYTLNGEGSPGIYGIVPPAFKNYDSLSVKGYNFAPDKAKMLLSEAGYPNGEGFPKLTLQLNSGGSTHVQIAEVIQKQLKDNLNIDIELNVMPWAQHLENLETGKALYWRSGWIADYPDPENFLNLLYSNHIPAQLSEKSYLNSVRYENPLFDSLFTAARKELDDDKRYEIYALADQVAMDDAAIMPIYYPEHTRLLQKNVRNFGINAMEYRDLSEVFFASEEEMRRQAEKALTRRRPSKK